MKRFEELSETEMLALTEAEILRWIDVECACEGVPLLPPEPAAPIAPLMTPDVTVYSVGTIHFARAEDAATVADVAMSYARHNLDYVSGPRYEKKVGPPDDVVVTPLRAYSVKHWAEVKDDAERYTQAKATYDALKAEFDSAARLRDRIDSRVREEVERVQAAEYRRAAMRDKFSRYLDLAGGDQAIALRFLEAAEPDARALLPALFEVEDVMTPPQIL